MIKCLPKYKLNIFILTHSNVETIKKLKAPNIYYKLNHIYI